MNYSGMQIPVDTRTGEQVIKETYEGDNFSQPQPVDIGGGVFRGVRLFPGDDTPRTFIHCNLLNCEVPPGSTVVKCLTAMVETGVEVSTESIRTGGQNVIVKRRANIIHGKWTPSGYEDRSTPLVVDRRH